MSLVKSVRTSWKPWFQGKNIAYGLPDDIVSCERCGQILGDNGEHFIGCWVEDRCMSTKDLVEEFSGNPHRRLESGFTLQRTGYQK